MNLFAVKVNNKFVTFGEHREYILEDVPLEESLFFDEKKVLSVMDYFESMKPEIVPVELMSNGSFYI